MHTATQLTREMFAVKLAGAAVSLDEFLADWGVRDRLGVVVHEPFGALGASQLIQLIITAFYDAKPSRRAGKLAYGDPLAVYPEVYLFHVGGLYGDHSWLDVFPPRKEVVLPADPAIVLEAINDRGISWLAVPDVTPVDSRHSWKEPAAARDTIISAFAYSASGRTADADVEISGLTRATEVNATMILDAHGANGDGTKIPERFARQREVLATRYPAAGSMPAATLARRADAETRRRAARRAGLITESYRRIDVSQAIQMLIAER